MSADPIDEAFLPLADFVGMSADIEGSVTDPARGVAMTVEWTQINMPVEMDVVVDEDGSVRLGVIPPLYYVETSVMPVFHQVTLTLEASEGDANGR